ncbi:hypothetical protein [Paenibacillus pinihumi]|nr:hypothetical protein [Paenibacillus pinihumi]
MEVHISDARKVYTTSDPNEVNEMLEDGWLLADVTRGNLKYLFLLIKV